MKKICISFGSDGYQGTLSNLKNSAVNFFDEVHLYGEKDIEILKKNYPTHFTHKRGYGYWLWKPFLIKKTLDMVQDGDIVMYLDSTINFVGDPIELFELTNTNEIICFSSGYKNIQFIKFDVFKILNCLDEKFLNGDHVNAAMILIKKTENSVKFIDDYFNLCSDLHLISDSKNIYGVNSSEFIDHRHDQSLLSILCLMNGIELFRDPSQWGDIHKNLFKNSRYNTILNHHRIKY